MSNKSTKRSFAFLVVFVLSIAFAGADLVVMAQGNQNSNDVQNSNTSNTNDVQNSNTSNSNTSGAMQGNANSNTANDNTSTGAATTGAAPTGRRSRRGRRGSTGAAAGAATQSAGGGQNLDLSGTYSGTVNYPEGGLTGPATLAITGNQFTLTPEGGGSPVSGRVSATSTGGYTGVAMQLGTFTPATPGQPAPAPPVSVSLRMHKSGKNISLTSVPGAEHQFSFTPTSGRRSRRGAAAAAAPAPTTPATEATGEAGAAGTTTGTTGTTRRGRRGRRGNTNANTNANNSNAGGAANSNNSNQ